MDSKNLDRLSSELSNIEKYIIACGVNANIVVSMLDYANKLKSGVKIIIVKHIGSQSLNLSINKDINGDAIITYKNFSEKPDNDERTLKQIKNDNMNKRLSVVAKEIYDQMHS